MKKILLSLFVISVMGFTAKVQAQCNLFPNNLSVNLTSAVLVSGNCLITADIAFDIDHTIIKPINNKNKKKVIQKVEAPSTDKKKLYNKDKKKVSISEKPINKTIQLW